jgi:hypothetical protein
MDPQAPSDDRPSAQQPDPGRASLMQSPATRRETFLFGLLILALCWTLWGQKPRTIVVVPDRAVTIGVIT